jgi:hypothetical protein
VDGFRIIPFQLRYWDSLGFVYSFFVFFNGTLASALEEADESSA